MWYRYQYYCTERVTSTIIGWCCLFCFISSFWISKKNFFIYIIFLNWWCGWQWFGWNDFLLHPLRCFWLWYRHPLRWSRRRDWWNWHPLNFHREGDRWHIRSRSQNWRIGSVVFGRSSEEFYCFDKFIFGSVAILQWWYSWRCDLKDDKNVCCLLIKIIFWCDIWERNLARNILTVSTSQT